MGVNHLYGVVFLALVGVAGCTKHNPAVCEADSDCTDSTRPFCDVNGEYPESNHTPGECTVAPANCPVARCGCTPGETLSCSNGTATLCGTDGHSSNQVACALGCSTSETRCATFDPSNGLGPALADAAGQPDAVLPPGVHIDTDLGTIQTSSGNALAIKSIVVDQPGHASIRVFEAASFAASDATVSGTNALALVTPGAIAIQGNWDLSANVAQGGPGAQESPASCAGTTGQEYVCGGGLLSESEGGGGAGNATAGGTGGQVNNATPAGAADPDFVPLVGGCRGGDVQGAAAVTRGGAGGGALQLVSLESVTIRGLINLDGGGGAATTIATNFYEGGGGGAGGMLIIETPVVTLQGPGGVVTNGGAGGGCGTPGPNGTQTLQAAISSCTNAGAGGTGTIAPTNAYSCDNNGNVTCVCGGSFGGGGGAVGRIRVVTANAGMTSISNPLISAQVSTAMLAIH